MKEFVWVRVDDVGIVKSELELYLTTPDFIIGIHEASLKQLKIGQSL